MVHPCVNDNIATRTWDISLLDINLDVLIYPLLFPFGEQGWHDRMQQQGSTRRVTHMQYYSYFLSIRDRFNPILNAGKLFQQFAVNAYVKMEANRLNFIRQNQTQLRVEDYSALQDHLEWQAAARGVTVGKTVILPSSFKGSPRNMQQ